MCCVLVCCCCCCCCCSFTRGFVVWLVWYVRTYVMFQIRMYLVSAPGISRQKSITYVRYVTDTYVMVRPWTHTSDDSYMYQLSLVVATATVSYLHILYLQDTCVYYKPAFFVLHTNPSHGSLCLNFMPSSSFFACTSRPPAPRTTRKKSSTT